MRDPKLTFLIRCAYGAVWLALIWLMVRYVLVWLLPFLIALALAALLEPAVVLCRRRLHLRRGFTATVLSLVVLGTVAAGLVLLAMVLLRQVCELSGRLPGYLEALPRWTELVRGRAQQLCAACPEGLRSWLEALLDGLSAQLAELLESMGQRCLRAVTAAAAALPQAVLFCATTLLAVLFTAGSYPRIRAFLRRQLPEDRLRQARGVKADLLATLGKWCKAQCILLGVTFCELLTGFLLLRQGYALLLGGTDRRHRRPAGVRHGDGAGAVGHTVPADRERPQGAGAAGPVRRHLAGAERAGA